MLDLAYQTVLTLISKDSQGYLTPEEFNRLSNLAQMDIFRSYFVEDNEAKNKQNKGYSNTGYANLSFHIRQKIDQFADSKPLNYLDGFFNLPEDLYVLEQDGVFVSATMDVVEEVERKDLTYLMSSLGNASTFYPVYERLPNKIRIYPNSIVEGVECRYLRKPKAPKWTYFMLPNKQPKFDPTNNDFQDFELHEEEFSSLVVRILSFAGVTVREVDVVKIAEGYKQQINQENIQ